MLEVSRSLVALLILVAGVLGWYVVTRGIILFSSVDGALGISRSLRSRLKALSMASVTSFLEYPLLVRCVLRLLLCLMYSSLVVHILRILRAWL